MYRKRYIQHGVMVVMMGLMSTLLATGCGNSDVKRMSGSNTATEGVRLVDVTHTHEIKNTSAIGGVYNEFYDIYSYEGYKRDYDKPTVQFYLDGEVSNLSIPNQTYDQALEHRPWKTDPILSAVAYTINLMPHGFDQKLLTHNKTQYVYSYRNGTIKYSLMQENTTEKPVTAMVEADVLGLIKYNIYLFELANRYTWCIYKITMMVEQQK